jgi:glycosyltransferase involved in cell wall biosynthesis
LRKKELWLALGIKWLWWLVGLAGLLYWLWHGRHLLAAMIRPRRLTMVEPQRDRESPLVSVIVPARNEGESVRACLLSILKQDYPQVEIIAVDDRSSDATGAIMDEVAATDRRMQVIHVTRLPSGWLGKCHANEVGSRTASGQWLLFTDGDILFEVDTLSRAMAFVTAEGLDHLCLAPGLICEGALEKAIVCCFTLLFMVAFKLQDVRNPLKPKSFCGIGAFNLVRAEAYRISGGHERLRMEVADDVKLGKLLKMHGFVTEVLDGIGAIRVRWQRGYWGVVRGLEKNGFAGTDFQTWRAIGGILALAAIAVLPLVGSALAPGASRIPFVLWMFSEMLLLGLAARSQGFSPFVGLLFPVALLGIVFAVARSVFLALIRRGIYWRETFHSLEELRRGVV